MSYYNYSPYRVIRNSSIDQALNEMLKVSLLTIYENHPEYFDHNRLSNATRGDLLMTGNPDVSALGLHPNQLPDDMLIVYILNQTYISKGLSDLVKSRIKTKQAIAKIAYKAPAKYRAIGFDYEWAKPVRKYCLTPSYIWDGVFSLVCSSSPRGKKSIKFNKLVDLCYISCDPHRLIRAYRSKPRHFTLYPDRLVNDNFLSVGRWLTFCKTLNTKNWRQQTNEVKQILPMVITEDFIRQAEDHVMFRILEGGPKQRLSSELKHVKELYKKISEAN